MTDTKTPAELRTEAQAHRQAEADSFERSDTDGFMSQWASGLSARKADLAADIAENGGCWTFRALFDLEGNHIPAKQIDTRYGSCWALLDPANPSGRFLGFFNESNAEKETTQRRNNAKKGIYIGLISAPARADFRGNNICTVRSVAIQLNGPFTVVDNGQGEVSA